MFTIVVHVPNEQGVQFVSSFQVSAENFVYWEHLNHGSILTEADSDCKCVINQRITFRKLVDKKVPTKVPFKPIKLLRYISQSFYPRNKGNCSIIPSIKYFCDTQHMYCSGSRK